MAYTQADIDALDDAIKSGVKTVELEGKKVTYRSVDEMQQQMRIIRGGLTPQNRLRNRQTRVVTRKGL